MGPMYNAMMGAGMDPTQIMQQQEQFARQPQLPLPQKKDGSGGGDLLGALMKVAPMLPMLGV